MKQPDKHKKKAVVEATVVMIFIILLMFISGMTYMDPPPETGVAINFGTSDVGQGAVQPQHNTPPKPVQQEQPQTEPETQPTVKENVVTQDDADAPIIKQTKTKKDPKPTKPTKPAKPQPDKSITDILNNVNNAPGENTNNSTGQGNDNAVGDKGDTSGDPNASGYYGNGGNNGGGGTGNYRLGNRKALTKPKPNYTCNEEGTIVVKIYVNKSGKVIKAIPGVKGSTNNAPCLLQMAKQAAINTKWSADNKAPDTQIGKIIYHFKLTE